MACEVGRTPILLDYHTTHWIEELGGTSCKRMHLSFAARGWRAEYVGDGKDFGPKRKGVCDDASFRATLMRAIATCSMMQTRAADAPDGRQHNRKRMVGAHWQATTRAVLEFRLFLIGRSTTDRVETTKLPERITKGTKTNPCALYDWNPPMTVTHRVRKSTSRDSVTATKTILQLQPPYSSVPAKLAAKTPRRTGKYVNTPPPCQHSC